MAKKASKPNVFDYTNYRQFLTDYIDYLRSVGEFSNRKFAQKVGFKSHSHLRLIMNGQRNMSMPTVQKLVKAIGLTKLESKFFQALVSFNQAEDFAIKDELYRELLDFQKFRDVRRTAEAEYKYFSNWYIVAILEAIGTMWSHASPKQMAEDLGVPVSEVEKSLELLEKLGLAKNENGKWQRVDVSLETPSETGNLNIRNYHQEMGLKAIESLDEVAKEERFHTSLTIGLSEQRYQELRKELADLPRKLSAKYSGDRGARGVYQINFQLFPLIKIKL